MPKSNANVNPTQESGRRDRKVKTDTLKRDAKVSWGWRGTGRKHSDLAWIIRGYPRIRQPNRDAGRNNRSSFRATLAGRQRRNPLCGSDLTSYAGSSVFGRWVRW